MRKSPEDILLVSSVLDHDDVFVPVNGYSCRVEGETAYGFLSNGGVYVLMPNELSVLIFVPISENMFNVHIAFLPQGRGKLAVTATLNAFKWMFENTSCTKIIGFESVENKAATRFVSLLGVDVEGRLKRAGKNGEDMIIYGLCK